jgi:hypothetical protein
LASWKVLSSLVLKPVPGSASADRRGRAADDDGGAWRAKAGARALEEAATGEEPEGGCSCEGRLGVAPAGRKERAGVRLAARSSSRALMGTIMMTLWVGWWLGEERVSGLALFLVPEIRADSTATACEDREQLARGRGGEGGWGTARARDDRSGRKRRGGAKRG